MPSFSVHNTQAYLLASDLLPSEKLVGFSICYHINKATGVTRLRQQKIADECGLSLRAVKRAVSSLERAHIVHRQITGRSSIYSLLPCSAPSNITSNVEGPLVAHQTGQKRHVSASSSYDLDTEFSTAAEEKSKREDLQFQREEIRRAFRMSL